MTADIELLPLPDDLVDDLIDYSDRELWGRPTLGAIKSAIEVYGLDMAQHNVKARDAEIEKLRALLTEAADALEAARENACVALVADIRLACGDNGKRMQPELVEFIRGLAADAERWRAQHQETGDAD